MGDCVFCGESAGFLRGYHKECKELGNVPKFQEPWPSKEDMNLEQRSFFKVFVSHIEHGEYVDLKGQISYLFLYLYDLLNKWDKKGFDQLYAYLLLLSELYKHEEKVSDYCIFWAHDCLLGLEKYELYLERSEPKEPFGSSTHPSNLRLNIQKHLGEKANPIDLVLLAGGRKNKILKEHTGAYKDFLYSCLQEHEELNGNWFDKFLGALGENAVRYKHGLFDGAVVYEKPLIKFGVSSFYSASDICDEIKDVTKIAENRLRESLGIPKIGEGWVSETLLYIFLENHFKATLVIQHGRPNWLRRQHFDIWFPNWNIAVEYQGEQHFKPIDFFGGEDAYKKNLERDRRKMNLAIRHGVKLFIVTERDTHKEIASKIEKYIKLNRKIKSPEITGEITRCEA